MAAPHLSDSKALLRQQARALRDRLEPNGAAHALAVHLAAHLGSWRPAVIGCYWPIASEIDPRPALWRLCSSGSRPALPETPPPGTALGFRIWSPDEPLQSGRYGTLYAAGAEVVPELLLVPMLAFDRTGHRLGYGGGYYDRTLAAWPRLRAIGCAYAAQELPAIPAEPHDIRLHAIATERGVIITKG